MYQKVKAYVKKCHMLTGDDNVIAGISGGADSICLLFVLLRLQKEIPFTLTAVHVHHGLRGESADHDEAYVKEVCSREHVELVTFHEDVERLAREQGLTLEEAGRQVRRTAFEQVLKEKGGNKIALAHHLNDNAETLLWNLCRGTGLKGLGGIAPVSGVWIRPFLCVKRIEIESYLKKWGISYCTDETNLENVYTRNKIRNQVIPYLEANLNEQAAAHIAETAEQMRVLGEYIEEEAARAKNMCTECREPGETVLVEEKYRQIAAALQPYVLHQIICETAGRSKDIEAVHVKSLEDLLEKQVGRRVELPYEVTAVRCYEGLRFYKGQEKEAAPEEGEFVFRIMERGEKNEVFPEKPYTKWFDYDIIENTVKIRHRQPGDYITIDKAGNTQKLKQYFINEKIPQSERDAVWLAADGSHIMWIVGYRQNQMYQITERTKRILEIQLYKGENHGRDN